MPANAGPPGKQSAGNRLSTSDSLATHDVWKKTVKYDPYAGADEGDSGHAIPEVGEINSSAKGLFRLAQLTGNSSSIAPGACKRCGQVGHLFFACRNYLTKDNKKSELEQMVEEEEDEDVDECASSDDDDDDSDDSSDNDSDDSDDDDDKDSDDSSADSDDSGAKKKGKKRKQPSKKEKENKSKSKKKSKKKDKKKDKKDKKKKKGKKEKKQNKK
mmetsp:Transcript_39160/g.101519  ORF Transcript_39160/g.101519 Transcript_39160/m.101519 type:complete len:215 (-) Transcript_39160:118-762(-)|eukprot:CAMPEP_0183433226 /NCGR_PEP_ID=MMETSP0370-20130417/61258_1 /TAXON_ID=268820 /ORGANISM="Peridinium aciculiferum, Strain PAER-2" /LENGTH=214 /DNA_ID=CAMNT_0025619515 /DNA_START=99 /DNA_END=743 /DNA_ORIENTATION=+